MNEKRTERIEQVLTAWDGAKRAEAPAFFYSRLKAKMEKGSGADPAMNWYMRPVFVVAALIAVVIINAFIFFQKTDTPFSNLSDETIQSVAAEYNLSDNLLEDINP